MVLSGRLDKRTVGGVYLVFVENAEPGKLLKIW